MKQVVADSFEAFLKHALSVEDFPVYRGMSNIDFPLIPRLGRADTAELARSFGNDLFELEKTVVGQFKAGSIPYLDSTPSNEWEWLCVMQHHGSPTRLLDWTLSPLAAAFFALRHVGSQRQPNTTAVVYGLKAPNDLLSIGSGINPWQHDRVEFFPAPHISRRVTAQQSYFSFHPNPRLPFNTDDLIQIAIPVPAQARIAYLVSRLGFRETTMFPGLDSINDAIRKALKL